MASMGYTRSAQRCKEKWANIVKDKDHELTTTTDIHEV
jgi:hypothetical protein